MKSADRKSLSAFVDYALERPGLRPQAHDAIGLCPILVRAWLAAAAISLVLGSVAILLPRP